VNHHSGGMLKFSCDHFEQKNLFPCAFFYLVTCALVVFFVMHYKPFRRKGYPKLVYHGANSEEWPAWIGEECDGRLE